MSQSEIAPRNCTRNSSRPVYRQPAFWLVTGLLFAAVTTARLLKAPPPADPLHGDVEDAARSLNEILAKTPAEQRLPLLLKEAQDSSPGLRYVAIDKLGDSHEKATTGVIESAFRDSSLLVRIRALEVLPDADPERGFRLLLTALRDDDTQVRADALLQFASRLGTKQLPAPERAIPTLLTLLDSPDNGEVASAMVLLHNLTGRPWMVKLQATSQQYQAASAQWKQWAQSNPPALSVPPDFQNIAPLPPTRADVSPDFNLPDIDGHPIALSTQKGHITLLNFWGTWCGSCIAEIPDLVRLDQTLRSQQVDIIGIAFSEDSEQTLRDWSKAHNVTYRQAMATDSILHVFGDIHEAPVSILLDQQGRIRYRWDGPCDFATFHAAIERLLK